MRSTLNFGKAYRKLLRLMTNTIVAYSVIATLIAGSFGMGILYQDVIAAKEYNRLCLEMIEKEKNIKKDKDELFQKVYMLQEQNISLEKEIIELKVQILSYEKEKK